MHQVRFQLSMFVDGTESAHLENIRQHLDPIQAQLIAAHVTLCREDELLAHDQIEQFFATNECVSLSLSFGAPQSFHTHGVLLPCVGGAQAFHALRQRVLNTSAIANLSPHITLAHPRNPKAIGNHLGTLSGFPEHLSITFSNVCLIRQTSNNPWEVIRRYDLSK